MFLFLFQFRKEPFYIVICKLAVLVFMMVHAV